VFHNPDRKRLARNEYNLLKIEPKQDFTDFLAEFTRLAEEADQPMDLRKQDLYQKIPTLIQNQVIIDVDDNSASLEVFVRKCQRTAGLISQQQATRNANRNNRNGGNRSNKSSDSAPNSANTTPSNSKLTDAEKAALIKEGKCFFCREHGHVSRNCPKKKKDSNPTGTGVAAAAPSLEPRVPEPRKKVDLEAAEEPDSEKE
jgi:hypothetical protein